MAQDESAKQSVNEWPLPKYYFEVDFGDGNKVSFREVSGLSSETQQIEYRHGNNPVFSVLKMPGIQKFGNITLKKGIFAKDNSFLDWYKQIKLNTISRKTVTISLLDETGAATMMWTLKNAWPAKISGTDLKSEGNEVAIETIEMAFEGLEVSNR